MKEYDEDEAIAAMAAAIPENTLSEDDIYQVLDLIYDYYDENGQLDIDSDDDDDTDIAAMIQYIARFMKGRVSDENIKALVEAEIAYEESLF